jgi:hypothetical protein
MHPTPLHAASHARCVGVAGDAGRSGGRRKIPVYVVEYPDTFALPVPDDLASPVVFKEKMLRVES